MEKIALLLSDFYFRAMGTTIPTISNEWQYLWLRKPGRVPSFVVITGLYCLAKGRDCVQYVISESTKSGNVKRKDNGFV